VHRKLFSLGVISHRIVELRFIFAFHGVRIWARLTLVQLACGKQVWEMRSTEGQKGWVHSLEWGRKIVGGAKQCAFVPNNSVQALIRLGS
jgi:hypothetical protein